MPATRRFERYVAIGDSSTEGLDDPDGSGGFRGWANRLAEQLAAHQGRLLYANLAVRGRRAAEVRHEQLEPAAAMRPDLATVFAGTNDVVRPRCDVEGVAAEIGAMQRRLVDAGATVLSFTLPDLAPVLPLARVLQARTLAFNDALRRASARSGAILVDFAAHSVASDPRLWSDDRFHANALGHARIADALANALGIRGPGASWAAPLPPAPVASAAARLAAELRWARRYLFPWLWRHARGRSSGDGRRAKQPELRMLEAAPGA